MTLPLHGFQDWQNPLHTADLQTDVNNTDVAVGATFVSPVYDMRPYQSFKLMNSAISNVSPPTGYGHVNVRVQWYADAGGAQILYHRRYSWFPQGVGGAFASALGRVMLHDVVRGPYLKIVVFNGGTDVINYSWRLVGNTRQSGASALMNTDINGNNVLDSDSGLFAGGGGPLGAGAANSVIWPMTGGQVSIFTQSLTQPFLYQIFTPAGNQCWFLRTVAGAEINSFAVMPRTALRAVSTNVGAGAGTATIIGQADMANDR